MTTRETSGVAATVLRSVDASKTNPSRSSRSTAHRRWWKPRDAAKLDHPPPRRAGREPGDHARRHPAQGTLRRFRQRERPRFTPGGLYSATFQIVEDRVPGGCAGPSPARPPIVGRPAADWNRRDRPFRLRIRRSTRKPDGGCRHRAGLRGGPRFLLRRGRSAGCRFADILTALRWEMFGPTGRDPRRFACGHRRHGRGKACGPRRSRGAPMLTWTGEIGRVLSATLEGRRQGRRLRHGDPDLDRAVGKFHSATGGWAKKVRGFRPWTFFAHWPAPATNGKVVLGEILGGNQPVRPVAGTARRGAAAAEHPSAQRPQSTATMCCVACRSASPSKERECRRWAVELAGACARRGA